MAGRVRWGVVLAVLQMLVVLGLAATAVPARAVVVVPPRPGQIGLGLQGQYGVALSSGDLGEDFESGPGLAVRLRYRMRYERGFGLSFESQKLDVRPEAGFTDPFTGEALAPGDIGYPTSLTVGLYGLEFYQMFGTRTRTTRMLSVGAGLARLSRELVGDETDFPGDGLFVSAGAGVERFFWQSWGMDFSTRYYAVFHEGQANHLFHVSAGLVFYASL